MYLSTSIKDLISKAEYLEDSDLVEASKLYLQALKEDMLHEKAYDRLMIIYRKQKDYEAEVDIINKGLKAYTKFYNNGKSKSKKVVEISSKLAKTFDLVDKKGKSNYEPEPVARWTKRKAVVEKKLHAKKK